MGGTVRKLSGRDFRFNIFGVVGTVAVAALMAGCSADISRFDYPAFGLTSDHPQAKPVPPEAVTDGSGQDYLPNGVARRPAPPPDYNSSNFGDNSARGTQFPFRNTSAAAPTSFGTTPGQPESYHPERLASNGQTAYIVPPANGLAPTATANPAAITSAATPRPRRPQSGAIVEVLPGETLYQFSRRNGVSIAAVMQANNLRTPTVQPGEKLIIPGKGGRSILPPTASASPMSQPAFTPAAATSLPRALSTAVRDADDNPDGTYTVRAGDSIYGIARKHNVRPEEIMAANGIGDGTKVRFGQILKMPAGSSTLKQLSTARKPAMQLASSRPLVSKAPLASANQTGAPTMNDASADGSPDGTATDEADGSAPLPPVAQPNANAAHASAVAKPVAKPAVVATRNAPVDPASAPVAGAKLDMANDAGKDMAADTPSDGRFRWPVHGRIIGKFGPGGKAGQQNEGIDLAVPLGTEVHAAENGVVAYSGDELKGYGKLILIRHADNWVTAYAHNDELLVKHGDQIRRGQVIAKAGKSGDIDQPLLHFELRKGSQPVDPMPHMASN